jgi:hypothetical protein
MMAINPDLKGVFLFIKPSLQKTHHYQAGIISSIEDPCSKPQGMFCPTAVLRGDCKEFYNFSIRSLTLQQAAGNELAIAVQ